MNITGDIKWWFRRIRMHPRVRGMYSKYLAMRRKFHPSRFTDADPFKIIYVNPQEITERASNLPRCWGRVIGGEREREPPWSGPEYEALKKRYADGKDWSEIEYSIEQKEYWETLCNSMQEHGYQSQAELNGQHGIETNSWDCEVGVAIAGDGEVLWIKRDSHRLRMAKFLGIEKIPVQVRLRHTEWQTIRDEIRKAKSSEELSPKAQKQLSHPDVVDIRDTLSDVSTAEQRSQNRAQMTA